MTLNDTVYKIVKWVTVIALPAIATAYAALAKVWSLPYASQIPTTLGIVATLLGALLVVSTASYYQTQNAALKDAQAKALPDELHNGEDGK